MFNIVFKFPYFYKLKMKNEILTKVINPINKGKI